ncbi:prepilin peptidase [Alkaliphilus transvaalensis]|uniref:prepilin peptidase n=1 Tax=Alkaliphilus transvaalensis TaxID=114628 RepID=UPI0006878D87|nr:A24 family peptidase [Alkaliphilus transvaalensis]
MELAFFSLLLLCSIYDIRKRIIPNNIILGILMLGLFRLIVSAMDIGSLWGFFIPAFPLLVVKFFNPKYIGAGDIKLLMAIGVWVGYKSNILVYILACTLALVWALLHITLKKQIKTVPFAPFITVAVAITVAMI